jgi:uncharacterized membrane protein
MNQYLLVLIMNLFIVWWKILLPENNQWFDEGLEIFFVLFIFIQDRIEKVSVSLKSDHNVIFALFLRGRYDFFYQFGSGRKLLVIDIRQFSLFLFAR